jgi:co-chaperonin GroES (HSP10)
MTSLNKYPQGQFPVTGYRVVIKQIPVETISKGGIIIDAGDAQKRRQAGQIWGTLVARGDIAFKGKDWGDDDRDMYEIGTKVLYRRYAGQGFTLDATDPNADKYELCADSDVLMPVPDGMELTLIKRGD